ncbi:MAG TPA: type II toxin-antitoxin system VapC family toxin [Solirubrobacterales bacterium]|jgi:predicted nucleic acid-binding protein|nr:type II toxin-antitoxin system VapC family toxin [Solirubrobacterales bacterium]
MFLVDASVWLKLEQPQERYHEAARSIVLNRERSVAALDLTLYEVVNVAVRKMCQPERALYLSRLILIRCGDGLLRIDEGLASDAARLAAEHGLTAYNAAYVAASRRHGWTLVSADIADLVSKGLAVAPDAAVYP